MAVISIGEDGGPRAPSLRGAVYFYTRRGIVIAAKWPRKRGSPRSKAQKEAVEWFTQVRKFYKWQIAPQQIACMTASAGTPLYPSDVFTSFNAARFAQVELPGNITYRSARAMKDVSLSLDQISDVPGYTLVRGETWWEGQPASSGSGGAWVTGSPTSKSTSNPRWKGITFTPGEDIEIDHLSSLLSPEIGRQYRQQLWRASGFLLVEKLFEGPIVTATSGAQLYLSDVFDAPIKFNAGERVVAWQGRVDGGNDNGSDIYNADSILVPTPLVDRREFANIAVLDPQPGQTITHGTSAFYNMNAHLSNAGR